MYYTTRHITRFRYSAPISESMMEVRMRPRTEGTQRCLDFSLQTAPRTHTTWYRDYLGNMVYHFDIPGRHTQLTITAESLVELTPPPPLPEALPPTTWDELDAAVRLGDFWDMLMPSHFARATPLLAELARELDVQRREDPLSLLRELNAGIYATFAYMSQITEVDSPIDDALKRRQGVCQDFSHVMIALVREWLHIPCRYVSGYLFHSSEEHDRSEQDATHAWVEVFLPNLGWVGFDPTNNLIAMERHIRTAVGRDYADVPPTRGVFKGQARTELDVGVQVTPTEAPPPDEELLPPVEWNPVEVSSQEELQQQHQQEQDQQQQQQQQ